ncbi:MAG TPA: GNAT family N-acetyltransferase [Phycisphaerales bacterium]|nr:GNAT family N-acetyltransferase [Phycisphaerales bacterium]
MPAREFRPRDGSAPITIRPMRARDAAAKRDYLGALIEARAGLIRTPEEFQDSTAAVLKRFRQTMRSGGNNGPALQLLAERDQAVLGDIMIRRYDLRRLRHIGHIGIGVHPRAQGVGLGRALMQAGIDWARSTGDIRRLDLAVLETNTRAIALYESLGFVREGLRRGYVRDEDGRETDDLIMALRW